MELPKTVQPPATPVRTPASPLDTKAIPWCAFSELQDRARNVIEDVLEQRDRATTQDERVRVLTGQNVHLSQEVDRLIHTQIRMIRQEQYTG